MQFKNSITQDFNRFKSPYKRNINSQGISASFLSSHYFRHARFETNLDLTIVTSLGLDMSRELSIKCSSKNSIITGKILAWLRLASVAGHRRWPMSPGAPPSCTMCMRCLGHSVWSYWGRGKPQPHGGLDIIWSHNHNLFVSPKLF